MFGIVEIGLIFLVGFGIYQFLNQPRRTPAEAHEFNHKLKVGFGIAGLIAVGLASMLVMFRTVSYETAASQANQEQVRSMQEQIDAEREMRRLYEDVPVSLEGHHVAAEAHVASVSHTAHAQPTIALLVVVLILVAVGILAVTGAVSIKYTLIGLGGIGMLLFLGLFVVQDMPVQHTQQASSPRTPTVTAPPRIAPPPRKLASSEEVKPPIKIDTDTSEDLSDINTPLKIVDIQYTKTGKVTNTSKTLPKWLKEPLIRDKDRLRLVLSSARFATPLEAEQSLINTVRHEIMVMMLKEYPGMGDWQFNHDQLYGTVITRRCDVAYPLKVGGFTEQVYEVSFEIDLDQQELYTMWRPIEVNKRLTYLGIAATSITLLLGAGAFITRRKDT